MIFEAISECQQLYPDPDLSSDSNCSEAEDGNVLSTGEYFTTADGLEHLSIEGETVLSHLESILHVQNTTPEKMNGEQCYGVQLSRKPWGGASFISRLLCGVFNFF